MKQYAVDLWSRAAETWRLARLLVGYSDDDAASRAYNAAFHAVSAPFTVEGRTFTNSRANLEQGKNDLPGILLASCPRIP